MVGALNRLTRRALPKVKFYTSIVVLFAYCAIAAFPASLIRASVMSLCGLYAAAAGRRYDMPSGIAFSAIVILLADPAALYSIGFELSFGAVIMISLLMRPETELLSFHILRVICGKAGRHNAACMLIRVSRLLRGIRPAAGFPLKKVRRMRRIAVCGCAVYAVVWIYGIMLIWII